VRYEQRYDISFKFGAAIVTILGGGLYKLNPLTHSLKPPGFISTLEPMKTLEKLISSLCFSQMQLVPLRLGAADAVTAAGDVGEIFEVKCVQRLLPEHILQLACYQWLGLYRLNPVGP
jgi:hypothetical protein